MKRAASMIYSMIEASGNGAMVSCPDAGQSCFAQDKNIAHDSLNLVVNKVVRLEPYVQPR
jgi:hypothetical protein